MKNLAIISCISTDRGIGKDGQLLWHFKPDMQFFRRMTEGNTTVMGRKTYLSIGRPLPKRKNIVLSRQDIPEAPIEVYHSESELRQYIMQHPEEKIYIIGGATLYQMFLEDAKKLYLTEVQATRPADTFFPEFDKSRFTRHVLESHEIDGVKLEIVQYARN